MPGKILFAVTNHSELGTTGKKTGWYLPEVAHPYHVFVKAGYTVDFISPKGGLSPVDEGSKSVAEKDEVSKDFLNNHIDATTNTKKPSDVSSKDYVAFFYPGGHGPLWDLADNSEVGKIAAQIYEHGGPVGAVCHGPAGLLSVKLSNGEHLVKGKKVTGFSNEEEEAAGLTKVVPFSLEDKLKEQGGIYSHGPKWAPYAISDGRVVTGQNPASSTPVAEEFLKLL